MALSSGQVSGDLTASHDSQHVKEEEVPQYSDALKTELTTTPPSSPPELSKAMASQSQEMPPPAAPASKTRKRSRGESADIAIHVPDSSASVDVDIDPLASQDKEQDTSTDSTAAIMQNQRLARSSQPAPTSAQNAEPSRRQRTAAKSDKTEKSSKTALPAKPAQQETCSDECEPDSDMSTSSDDPGLPQDRIEYYDWSDLEHRYHQSLAEVHGREQKLFSQLGELIAVTLSVRDVNPVSL